MLEAIICCAEKDAHKLKYVIPSIEEFLPEVSVLYLISPREIPIDFDVRMPVLQYRDEQVLNFDRNLFTHRPNWMFQQHLKLLQDITCYDNYLVLDADIIFTSPLFLFPYGKPCFYLGRDQHHKPYFDYMQKMFGLEKVYPHSFINEFMVFNRQIVKELLASSGIEKGPRQYREFINRSAEITSPDCYISEFELYGNYVCKYLSHRYLFSRINCQMHGLENDVWKEEDIEKRIMEAKSAGVHALTIHTWV